MKVYWEGIERKTRKGTIKEVMSEQKPGGEQRYRARKLHNPGIAG